jgi:hypothetical protein
MARGHLPARDRRREGNSRGAGSNRAISGGDRARHQWPGSADLRDADQPLRNALHRAAFLEVPENRGPHAAGALPNLTHVAFYWNQRTERLWNFAKTSRLQGLQLDDFTRLHDLSELEAASGLDELRFGNMIWRTATFVSLDPLRHLLGLRSLSFEAKRIDDGRVQPLGELQRLESLRFPSNQFTTEQVAWLRARLPDTLRSQSLEPIRTLDRPIPFKQGAPKDTLVVGKRKPFLNSIEDADRIAGYIDAFSRMVHEFRQHPEREPGTA